MVPVFSVSPVTATEPAVHRVRRSDGEFYPRAENQLQFLRQGVYYRNTNAVQTPDTL